MSYTSSNFIKTYQISDRVIQIQNSLSQKIFSLNVCNENKIYVSNNLLVVVLEDNSPVKQYTLDFSSNVEANAALLSLKSALDTLKVNCSTPGTTPPSPSSTPIVITYLQYKASQQTGGLIALQWYDVSDTTNLLGYNSATIRLLAKSIDDFEPSGIIISTKELVVINTLDDTTQRYEFATQKILGLNKSKIVYDANSNYIKAANNSTITSTSSTHIEASENSTLIVSGCNNVKVFGATNVTLSNATNITIDNIQQDLSSIGFNLVSITLNPTNSIGKDGRGSNVNKSSDLSFISYKDFIDQVFNYTTSNNTIIVTLDNKITQANGTFRIKYTGSGSGNTLTVQDSEGNVLYQINDTVKECWAVFKYNPLTSLFEFINLDLPGTSNHTVYQTTPASDGQTSFTLPVPATIPAELEMFVNGNKVKFGPDFTYASPNVVTFKNRLYSLATTDEIEFNIY